MNLPNTQSALTGALRKAVIAGLVTLSFSTLAVAAEDSIMIDCPLRDQPFSIESPLMDILLSPQALAIANRHMGGALEKLPPRFASKDAPSFSAILTLKTVVSMAQLSPDILVALDKELAELKVTDADRIARCARYDVEAPAMDIPEGKPRLLLFEKMTGFRDGPSVEAATAALRAMAEKNGWALAITDKGGAMTPEILAKFDAVIWNNVSGDVLTLSQRKAFEDYIHNGGGYVGIHGSAGDFIYFWDWYVDSLIGARFIGHPMAPQFQDAKVKIEKTETGIGAQLGDGWTMNDEWYSFKTSPRSNGATVVATLDEGSYSPVGHGGQDIKMGDHPIAWSRCVGTGRSFYSAIGHRPETYVDAKHLVLLQDGILWAAGVFCEERKITSQLFSISGAIQTGVVAS